MRCKPLNGTTASVGHSAVSSSNAQHNLSYPAAARAAPGRGTAACIHCTTARGSAVASAEPPATINLRVVTRMAAKDDAVTPRGATEHLGAPQ